MISHSEFDVVDFLICEIEHTVLDGLRAQRQLSYAHYLCYIFAQLIQPPQFQGTLEASRLHFGSYLPAPEDLVPVPDPVTDIQVEDTAFHQFETQGTSVPDDDATAAAADDDFGIPPPLPPPMPPRSHDHEVGSSSAIPATPPAVDPALVVILQSLAQQQALMAPEQARQIPPIHAAPPLALQVAIVPAIQVGPPLPSVGPSTSPIRSITLDFSSPVISSVSAQPPVPPTLVVTTAAVAVSVTSSALTAPVAQPQSESVPALASTADPESETDSDPHLAFALLPRPRPNAPPPPPSTSGYRFGFPFGV
eukprot:XP_020407593.1 calphotin-like [Zea mays]